MDTTHVAKATTDFGVFENLTQYGALGLIVLALGAAAWYMFKRIVADRDRLQAKVDELEKELIRNLSNHK